MSPAAPESVGGTLTRERSGGFVPSSIKFGNEVNNNIIEVLIAAASFLHPDAETIDALSPKDRKKWVKFQDAVIRGQYSITDLMKALNKALTEQHTADLADQEQLREERGKLFAQRLSELKTNHEGRSEERKQVLRLITLCVIAAVICGCLTAMRAQPWDFVGAGACTGLVAVIGILYRFRALIARSEPPNGLV
jgi:hypothetical protein